MIGKWTQDINAAVYSVLLAITAIANLSGFISRELYYIPRADLSPAMFSDLLDMWNDIIFAKAKGLMERLKEKLVILCHCYYQLQPLYLFCVFTYRQGRGRKTGGACANWRPMTKYSGLAFFKTYLCCRNYFQRASSGKLPSLGSGPAQDNGHCGAGSRSPGAGTWRL